MRPKERLKQKLEDPAYRHAYAEAFLDSSIALQIKALREQRRWTQADLAERAGMKQSRISTMEQADYSSWSVKTLRRLAQAFDLVLVVRFENWSKLLGEAGRLSRANLERPSFAEEPGFGGFERHTTDLVAAWKGIMEAVTNRPGASIEAATITPRREGHSTEEIWMAPYAAQGGIAEWRSASGSLRGLSTMTTS